MSNTFKKFQIDALEGLVEQHKHDPKTLKHIDAELAGRRVRSRNTELRSRIKKLLVEISASQRSEKSANLLSNEVPKAAAARETNRQSERPLYQSSAMKEQLASMASSNKPLVSSMSTNKTAKTTTSSLTMKREAPVTYPDKFLVSAFEGMRQKLLDISGGRSRLLNLDQKSRSFVRIVDELPDELAKLILSEKSMLITPVPQPTLKELIAHGYLEWDEEEGKHIQLKKDPDAKEWAGILGIDNKFDLPESGERAQDGRHTDSNLQSMLFDAQLNVAVKKLASEAKTAIEETGNNILFLCLGFLEWVDQADSSNKRLAPLYMLPITITKDYRNGIAVYKIKYNGEDIIHNLILREKLQQDFGLTLPDITDPDNEDRLLTPEEYFDEVSALLARKQNDVVVRRWKVRRFATLATLSLGKLLMYRDLDPRNWPAGEDNLLEHAVIKRFFHDGAQSSSGGSYNESYVLDDVRNLHEEFPMIEDADSSQMSVLIDVLKGKNLVVEGPPGTGKSQTITNIISAALSQGKTVLFVAEKQAALEVVKRRMDKAGLGDFCLDLHSDKAQKRLVLDDFKQRISKKPSFKYNHSEYSRELERYERAREKLQNYVQLINREWKGTGLTIHEILMAATRYEATVAPLTFKEIVPENVNSETFSKAKLDEKIEQLEVFYNYLSLVSKQLPEVGNWASHPWFGVENKALSGQDPDEVLDALKHWNVQLSEWSENVVQQCRASGVQFNGENTISDAEALVNEWQKIPTPEGNVDFNAVSSLTVNQINELEEYVSHHRALASSYLSMRETFTRDVVENIALIDDVDSAIKRLSELGVDQQTKFEDVARALLKLGGVIELFNKVQISREELVEHLPDPALSLLRCDLSGLKDLETFISLAASLPGQYVSCRDALFDNEMLFDVVAAFTEEHRGLVKERDELEKVFTTDKLPSVEVLQHCAAELENTGLFSWLKPSWREAKKSVSAFTKSPKFNAKDIALTLNSAADWSARCIGFSQDTRNNQLLRGHFDGLKTDVELVNTLVNWYQRVRAVYGIGFGKRVALAQALFSLPADVFRGIQNLHQQGMVNDLEGFRIECEGLSKVFTSVRCLSSDDVDLSTDPKPFDQTHEAIAEILADCQQYLIDAGMSQTELRKKIEECKALRSLREMLDNTDVCDGVFSEHLELTPMDTGEMPVGLDVVVDTTRYTKQVNETCKNEAINQLIKRQTSADDIASMQRVGVRLAAEHVETMSAEASFFASIGGERERWFQNSGYSLIGVVERNESAVKNGAWLDGWIKYLYAKERMEQGGFSLLNRYLSQNSHSLDYAQNAMKFATYHTLAREIYQEQPELSQMSGHEQTALQQQFSKYDEKLKELQRKRVAAMAAHRDIPAGMRGARAASYTGDALLQREIEKKTRHISIRNLVTRAGDAMIAYKPCFMMSPMAVAKYIPPGELNFDIVIMDEASQVKPQDALSCFARGKQIVVVGDSKQLPPTSFFEKSVSNDFDGNEEDTGVIDEAESILDAVGAYFDKRQLRWHYRSRHESLIEFSNHKFYDGNLVVFPSPWDQSDEFGIKFHHVTDGRFINSVNQTESHAVVAAIRDHLLHRSHESLGVVAMNSKQRDMIEADLESAISRDRILQAAYTKNLESEDPLFIKNLENVQGDERDVICISFTYGPQEKGASSIPQRFGPINGASGWRRLNVLFTRAKKRIQAYSSMTAEQIVLSDSSSLGVKSLKAYLQFAQTGQLIGQDGVQQGEPDSDFEIAVMDALSKHGFECVPQVGVAGFFIDIAVRDPGMPGRYLMGIECDGATYHSSKSTRDRDRVRQGVLEGLGWTIHRIWSTDWFKHPEAELKPIIDELKARSTIVQASSEPDYFAEEVDYSMLNEAESSYKASETLRDALIRYRDNVIGKKHPNTDPHEKLLRADMIERLVLDRPMTRDEFSLEIPAYLRENTCTKEAADYLDDVLEIITDYESIESFELTNPLN
ncbi:DUF4011 domain-containing anti-phage protein Hhe [Enterovibrio norvegicus]|uniref:DUF4011 domain-containing anti-phage protein Hhe n=1 Tax=Enterovibrio norvegicus TaxID=188144 RepID=UPI00352E5417